MLELVVLAGTFAVAGAAGWAQARRRVAALRAFDRYAQSRGLVFVPPPRHPRGASPRVHGEKDDVAYVIELLRLGGEVRTRVSASMRHGHGPLLSVLHRGAFHVTRAPALVSGHDAFDRAFVVTAGAAEDGDALREAIPALLTLDARRGGVWLAADGRKVEVSWSSAESDPVVIDAAREAALCIARCHRSDTPYR